MKRKSIFAAAIGIALTAGTLSACQSSTPVKSGAGASSTPTPSSTQSSGASQTLPIASNPIVNTATAPLLQVTYAAAENNVEPNTKAAISDRLELTVKNLSAKPLSGLEIYYEMTDIVTKAKEGYYQKLTGLVIGANQSTTIYFDGKPQPGHYPENQFSLYRTSPNEVDIKIWVSAKDSKIAHATAVKSVGTGEKPGA